MATYRKTPAKRWQAIVRINGIKNQTKTFKLKKDAQAWAQRLEGNHDLLRSLGSIGATMTFAELADEFEAQWTGKDDISGKVKFWVDHLGATHLLNITPGLIHQILNDYADGNALCGTKRRDTGRKRAPATVNRKRAMLSSIMKFATQPHGEDAPEGYLKDNPVSAVSALKENNKRRRYLSDNERDRLLNACKESQWDKLYLLVLLALTTGARQGELLKLRWSDIDFKSRMAQLRDTKNGDDRTISIMPAAIATLMLFRKPGPGLIFLSPTKFCKPFEFRKHWDRALVVAGIEDFHFHDLRHSAASLMMDADATLGQIGEVLGHKSTQTTMRYAHLSDAKKQSLLDNVMSHVS